MSLSIIDPVEKAFERSRRMMFEPFQIGKWFSLGFCAWLAMLGSGGGGGGANYMTGGGGPPPGGGPAGPNDPFREAINFLRDNIVLVLAGTLCFVTVMLLLYALVTWLSSRGQFMFVDGVARNQGAVVDPWVEYRAEGNSLFLFRFWFGVASFFAFILFAGLCGLIALPDIRAEQFGAMAILAILLGVVGILTLSVVVGCINVFLLDFVVPIMYSRRLPAMAAWGEFDRVLFREHKTTLLLYFLFQIVLSIGIALLSVAIMCVTCCCAALPYIGTVILLPLLVFHRSYSIYFLEQLGPEWQILRPLTAPTPDGYPTGEYPPQAT